MHHAATWALRPCWPAAADGFPVDSIVVRLFRQLLIPYSIPQYCKSLPRNLLYLVSIRYDFKGDKND